MIISHMHSDHFDQAAQSIIPKEMPIICQPEDERAIKMFGFSAVHSISQELVCQGADILRVAGKHGSGSVLKEMGIAYRLPVRKGERALCLLGGIRSYLQK